MVDSTFGFLTFALSCLGARSRGMFNTTRSTRPLAPVRIKWQCVIPLVACLLCAASGGSAHVPGPVWRVGGAGAGSERAGVGGVGAQLAQSYDSDIGELMRTRVCGCRALEEREDAAASSRVATVEGDGQGIVLRGGSGESELLGADGRIEMIIGAYTLLKPSPARDSRCRSCEWERSEPCLKWSCPRPPGASGFTG